MPDKESTFDFKLFSRMRYGAGAAQSLPELMVATGITRLAILVDSGVATSDYYIKIKHLLAGQDLIAYEHVSTIVEPTFDEVDSVTNQFRRFSVDGLVVFGGGSAIDLAKGVSVLLTNPGKAIGYRGYGLIKNPGIPLFVLPTTAGSGSEVTPNASYFDPTEVKKLGINSELYLPKQVILDPLLTVSCPAAPTASAGLDALVHTLEAFTARSATLPAKMFAREAFRLIFNSLTHAVSSPENISARGNMLLGAFYAGVALMNSASGPAGVLSYPLGVRFKVAHGFAGAVFLAPVIRYNLEMGYRGYAELFELIDTPTLTGSSRDYARALTIDDKNRYFHQAIATLCESVNAPSSLAALGVPESELATLAKEAFVNRTKSARQNPIDIDAAALEQIMRYAY